MRFRSYDRLRVFDVVARHGSFTAAAGELSLSKGAVSYQIKRLENELGFEVFARGHRAVHLTAKGEQLWRLAHGAFAELESGIGRLHDASTDSITIGMSSYFASRWLSPRLMTFICEFPQISLRLQPLIDLIDLEGTAIDMAIRWGNGRWQDLEIEPLLICPAFPTAGAALAGRVRGDGLERTIADATLLQDREGSEAWGDWHEAAGIPYRPTRDNLVVRDPNVRVQAVIDGQGLALNDALVAAELATRKLFKISEIELASYGYFLAYTRDAIARPSLAAFRDWIHAQADTR